MSSLNIKNKDCHTIFICIFCCLYVCNVFSGCSYVNSYIEGEKEAVKEKDAIEWPFPPDPPKIRYLKSISKESDVVPLAGEQPLWKKIFMFIVGLIGRGEQMARLAKPYGIAWHDGKMYVADEKLRVVHIFDFNERLYRQIGRAGRVDLISPIGVAVDSNGNIYVSDSQLKRVFVYNYDLIHFLTIGWHNEFLRPTGLAVNNEKGLLYVVDTLANRVMVYDLDGNYRFNFGKRGYQGEALNFPTNIFIDAKNRIFITDSMNFKVKIFDEMGIFIKQFGKLGDLPGYLSRPKGVAVDSDGNVYVIESLRERVQIYDEDGRFLLVFGNSGSKEGEFLLPSGIFIDSDDRIYVADSYNSRVQVFQYLDKQ